MTDPDDYDPTAPTGDGPEGPDECPRCIDGKCPSCTDEEAHDPAQALESTLDELHEAYRAVMIMAYVFNIDDFDIEDFDPVVDRVLRRADRYVKEHGRASDETLRDLGA